MAMMGGRGQSGGGVQIGNVEAVLSLLVALGNPEMTKNMIDELQAAKAASEAAATDAALVVESAREAMEKLEANKAVIAHGSSALDERDAKLRENEAAAQTATRRVETREKRVLEQEAAIKVKEQEFQDGVALEKQAIVSGQRALDLRQVDFERAIRELASRASKLDDKEADLLVRIREFDERADKIKNLLG